MRNSSTFILKNRNYIVTPLQDIFLTRYAEIDLIPKPLLGYDFSVTMSLIRIITDLSWTWENASFSMKNDSGIASSQENCTFPLKPHIAKDRLYRLGVLCNYA